MNQIGQTFLIFVTGLAGGIVGSMVLGTSTGATDPVDSGKNQTVLTSDSELTAVIDAMQGDMAQLGSEISQQKSVIQSLDARLANIQTLQGDGLIGGNSLNSDPLAGLDPAEIPSGNSFDAAVNAAIEKREADEAAERAAQRAVRREEQMERRMENYVTELGLDAAQADQMKAILLEGDTARSDMFTEMRESGTMDRQAMRDAMTELNESTNEKLGAVLNPTQMEQYSEMSSNSFGGFGGGRRGGNSGGGGKNEF
ncbi:MAG: hypothetical protein GY747_13175 [Planctomycetes bacterium]|nr:hypothetical protein [Planctomycetota bacterium]MCP4772038.1 hypothetical protein [Planctomycetota bacterium]MCP4860298.1 hypothetical protein [Planctomycetota bacterium]